MRYWTDEMAQADAVLFGRVTYEMMESAWRRPAGATWPDWMDDSEVAFAETIDRAKKYVVSTRLSAVDWNAELVGDDVGGAVQRLKEQPGERLSVGGVALPTTLAGLGLIDEYVFVVHPVVAGHGPTLLAGLRDRLRLERVDRREFRSGVVVTRYRPRAPGSLRRRRPVGARRPLRPIAALGAGRRGLDVSGDLIRRPRNDSRICSLCSN